jgi:DNA-binding CsgD family transcriptional regulator
MKSGRNVAVAPSAAGGITRDSVWTFAVTPAQRRSPPGGYPEAPPDLDELAWATVQVRTALEEMTVAARAAVAGARAIVEVMDAAVAVLEVAERASTSEVPLGVVARRSGGLSPREREVLTLVAEGRSNKAIAEALFISPNTIKTHVASLMTKLHADSRAQLAAIAARQEVLPNDAPILDDIETLAS